MSFIGALTIAAAAMLVISIVAIVGLRNDLESKSYVYATMSFLACATVGVFWAVLVILYRLRLGS